MFNSFGFIGKIERAVRWAIKKCLYIPTDSDGSAGGSAPDLPLSLLRISLTITRTLQRTAVRELKTHVEAYVLSLTTLFPQVLVVSHQFVQ